MNDIPIDFINKRIDDLLNVLEYELYCDDDSEPSATYYKRLALEELIDDWRKHESNKEKLYRNKVATESTNRKKI